MAIVDAPRDFQSDQPFVTHRLARLQARLNAQANRTLRTHGELTLTQWRVLVMLDGFKEASLSQMVNVTKFDKGLLSRTLKAMVEKDLLQVRDNEKDHRKQLYAITERGKLAYSTAATAMHSRRAALHECFTTEHYSEFLASLDMLEEVIDQLEQPKEE